MDKTRPLLLDAIDAGRLLGLTPSRVSRLAKRGALPCVALPDGELRYTEGDLREWVDNHRQPTSTEGRDDG